MLNYSKLIDLDTDIPDNSLVMLLRMLRCVEVKEVALAGFDGYSEHEMNYYNTNMEYSFAKEKALYLNNYVMSVLRSQDIPAVHFVTASKYEEECK